MIPLSTQPDVDKIIAFITQVHAGEVVSSARAIDEPTLKKIWLHMQELGDEVESNLTTSRKDLEQRPELWAGYNVRVMLYADYIISTICLLRHDETLKILWSDLTFETNGDSFKVTLQLPFRKTHQTGGTSSLFPLSNTACAILTIF